MHQTFNAMRHSALAVALAAGLTGAAALHYFAPSQPAANDDLIKAVAHLNGELQQLRQEREMPVTVVSRSCGSICYIYAVYDFEHGGHTAKPMRVHVSGTGFVVANGMIATNRHVAEPWWGDEHMEMLRQRGAQMKLEKLLAFFPGSDTPIDLKHVVTSADADLALAQFDPEQARHALHKEHATEPIKPLNIAASEPQPGDAVLVLGYPMGLEGMLAKSPRGVARRLSLETDDFFAVRQLASLSLIRPSATQGHLGDVVADKLLYDASTAQGASGSPVFNANGEVIGVNTAFLDGFSGGGIGVSAKKLKELMAKTAASNKP